MIKVLVEYDGEGRDECPSYFYTDNVPRIGESISFPVRDIERDLNFTTFIVKGIDYQINYDGLCKVVELFVEIER